jgi:hypothetical protein
MPNKDVAVTAKMITPKMFYILFGLVILFTITTIALAAVTLGVVVNRLDSKNTTNSLDNSGPLSFVDKIKIDELMKHLGQLQVIADQSNGTRAIGTRGFNDTLDYITNQLKQNTKLIIRHEYFSVRNTVIRGTPQLQSQINGSVNNHVYLTDFTVVLFSPGANFDSFVRLVLIPNLGCQDSDWMNASAADSIALVKRGECNFGAKAVLAEKYSVKGLLIYNDGTSTNGFQPYQNIRTYLNAIVPAYFLSYNLGMQFVNAASDPTAIVSIIMKSDVSNAEGIGNIYADTPTGDKTKTIVIGSHSDGVLDGSGINDNGKTGISTQIWLMIINDHLLVAIENSF